MLSQDTVDHFAQLSTEYDLLSQLLDQLRDKKAKPPSTPEQESPGRRDGEAAPHAPSRQPSDTSHTKRSREAPPPERSAEYRRGWEETYEGGRRWGQMRTDSPSEQLDEVIAEQVGALMSTLEQLEEIHDATGAATDAYERARGRLDGFNAGLKE